jgi:hypothetical protein
VVVPVVDGGPGVPLAVVLGVVPVVPVVAAVVPVVVAVVPVVVAVVPVVVDGVPLVPVEGLLPPLARVSLKVAPRVTLKSAGIPSLLKNESFATFCGFWANGLSAGGVVSATELPPSRVVPTRAIENFVLFFIIRLLLRKILNYS